MAFLFIGPQATDKAQRAQTYGGRTRRSGSSAARRWRMPAPFSGRRIGSRSIDGPLVVVRVGPCRRHRSAARGGIRRRPTRCRRKHRPGGATRSCPRAGARAADRRDRHVGARISVMSAPRCGSSGTCRRARSIRSRREESSCRRALLAAALTRRRDGAPTYVDALDSSAPTTCTAARRRCSTKRATLARRVLAAADRRRHDRRRARLHRPRARWQPHDARPRRHGPHRDAAGAIAWRPAGGVVEGRARHYDRGSAARRRCARDSAAASSRGRRSRALRREGASPARADSDRRHAHHAARAIVHRSVAAGHRSVGAPVARRRFR